MLINIINSRRALGGEISLPKILPMQQSPRGQAASLQSTLRIKKHMRPNITQQQSPEPPDLRRFSQSVIENIDERSQENLI